VVDVLIFVRLLISATVPLPHHHLSPKLQSNS